ncbi:MAG: hypothetical protein JW787_15375, partial [Sedimentisphaerales bacterium]|nr:hypothetical protein [Sedimentisphaerales bacterium]
MSRPGGCPSTGASKFSRTRLIILKEFPKSVPSLKKRIIAQLSTLRKKLTKPSLSNTFIDLINYKISKLNCLLKNTCIANMSHKYILKDKICYVHKNASTKEFKKWWLSP